MPKPIVQYLAALAALFLVQYGCAQDTVAWKKAYWAITENSDFPIFQSPENDTVALKVNWHLQSTLLHKLITPETTNPFDALDHGSTFLNYRVLRNDGRVLSVSFTMEGCGAYCENYSLTYSFNSISGELIQARDLFTKEGYRKAKFLIAEERKQLLKQAIQQKKNELKNAAADSAEADQPETTSSILTDQLDLYEECIGWRDSSTVNGNEFSLTDSSMWFIEGRCSNHAMRAIDELDEFRNELIIIHYSEFLNDYGEYIFGLSEKYFSGTTRFRMYTGSIGDQYPILFFENRTNGYPSYTYCYKKYGVLIELQNEESEDLLKLIETNHEDTQTGRFYLTPKLRGFSGSYLNASGTEMSFDVIEMQGDKP